MQSVKGEENRYPLSACPVECEAYSSGVIRYQTEKRIAWNRRQKSDDNGQRSEIRCQKSDIKAVQFTRQKLSSTPSLQYSNTPDPTC